QRPLGSTSPKRMRGGENSVNPDSRWSVFYRIAYFAANDVTVGEQTTTVNSKSILGGGATFSVWNHSAALPFRYDLVGEYGLYSDYEGQVIPSYIGADFRLALINPHLQTYFWVPFNRDYQFRTNLAVKPIARLGYSSSSSMNTLPNSSNRLREIGATWVGVGAELELHFYNFKLINSIIYSRALLVLHSIGGVDDNSSLVGSEMAFSAEFRYRSHYFWRINLKLITFANSADSIDDTKVNSAFGIYF
ncbi:MAG: hypothetical protein HN623_05430, partial [Bdellovibrionales bacterium]|nr:hypothetical protein [Bdellovibrionales bacterium]